MGQAVLLGAGLGALSSAAMGKSPITGALLGGVTGGAFGGAGGFGSGFTQGGLLSSAVPAAATTTATSGASAQLGSLAANAADDFALTALPTNLAGGVGSQGINNLSQFAKPLAGVTDDIGASLVDDIGIASTGMPSTNISLGFKDGIDALKLDPRRLAVDTPLTFGEKLSDLGSSAFSYGKENPMTLLGGANTLSGINAQNKQAQQQRLSQAVATGGQGITRPNFDPSSAIAAAPTYGLTQDELAAGKVSQLASKVRLPEEDERALRQFYTSLIG